MIELIVDEQVRRLRGPLLVLAGVVIAAFAAGAMTEKLMRSDAPTQPSKCPEPPKETP